MPLVAAVLVGMLAVPSLASAEYRGKTSQGKRVVLFTDAQNELARITFRRWRADCGREGIRFIETTSFVQPVDRSAPGRFFDRSAYRLHQEDGDFDIKVTAEVRGKQISERRWKGTFSPLAVVRRDGRLFDRCRAGRIRWRARLPDTGPIGEARATLEMHSDEGDYIGGGRDYLYETPRDAIHVSGTPKLITAGAGPWILEFAAPKGRRLNPGHFGGALRYPFNGNRPGLSITGEGRGCNEVEGEFTVERSRFGRRDRVRAIVLTFVQHCEGGPAALRGRLEYRKLR